MHGKNSRGHATKLKTFRKLEAIKIKQLEASKGKLCALTKNWRHAKKLKERQKTTGGKQETGARKKENWCTQNFIACTYTRRH